MEKVQGKVILKEKIPDANTDFIFAVAGEELGLIFCINYFNNYFIYCCKNSIKSIKSEIIHIKLLLFQD